MASFRFNQFTRGILLACSLLVLGLVLDWGKSAAWRLEANAQGHGAGLHGLSASARESKSVPHAPLTLQHVRHHAHHLHHWFFALTRGKVLHFTQPSGTTQDLSAKTG